MSKISIILFGLLIVLAVIASAENEEQSLSEKLSSMRVARDADAGRRRKKNKNEERQEEGVEEKGGTLV